MRQLVHTMFISDNHTSFHLWWKENLAKYLKVSKYYDNGCRWKKKALVVQLGGHSQDLYIRSNILWRSVNDTCIVSFAFNKTMPGCQLGISKHFFALLKGKLNVLFINLMTMFFSGVFKIGRLPCVKSVPIRSFSGPYFPTFKLNMEIYSVEYWFYQIMQYLNAWS